MSGSTTAPARTSERAWRTKEWAKARLPRAVGAYRRWVAPWLRRGSAPQRLSRWAATGIALREEFGTPAYTFDADGVWVTDENGLEFAYEPGRFLSAVGKEYGLSHDAAEIAHARSRIRAGGAFIDVGSHVGGYLIPLAVDSEAAQLHGFEPVPHTRSLLERNLVRNKVSDRVELWPCAASDAPGRMEITVSRGGENHLIRPGGAVADAETATVDVVTLDEHLAERCPRVDLIKCDIEGAEFAALRGARGILERDAPDLILEIDPRLTVRFGYAPEELFDWLGGLGYGWQRFVEGELRDATDLGAALAEGNNFLFRVS